MLESAVLLVALDKSIEPSTAFAAFLGTEVLLLGATLFLGRGAKMHWDEWWLSRGRAVNVADLADVRPWRRIGITGTVSAGPDGMLRAPLSGEPCVWWCVTTRESRRGSAAVVERREYSESPFTVEDTTGAVVISPGREYIHGAVRSLPKASVSEDGSGAEVAREEYVITEDTLLRVAGTPLPGEDGPAVFPGSEPQIAVAEVAREYRHGWFKGLLWIAPTIPFHGLVIAALVQISGEL